MVRSPAPAMLPETSSEDPTVAFPDTDADASAVMSPRTWSTSSRSAALVTVIVDPMIAGPAIDDDPVVASSVSESTDPCTDSGP